MWMNGLWMGCGHPSHSENLNGNPNIAGLYHILVMDSYIRRKNVRMLWRCWALCSMSSKHHAFATAGRPEACLAGFKRGFGQNAGPQNHSKTLVLNRKIIGLENPVFRNTKIHLSTYTQNLCKTYRPKYTALTSTTLQTNSNCRTIFFPTTAACALKKCTKDPQCQTQCTSQ